MKIGTDFSGIGSPESALKRLGLDVDEVFACEIDKFARASFSELHNPTTMYEDITTRNHSEVPQLDLYVAGFPCQSFSLAGKRGGFNDTRGTLFFNVAEFIKENQPKCFVLENVKGLLSHDNGRTYQTITDVLTNGGGTLNGQIGLDSIDNGLGYHVYTKVLNSKDYGIPQNRERIFLVGFKEFREFRFPKKMELKLRLKDLLEQEVDGKYYLSDKAVNRLLIYPRALPFTDTNKKEFANYAKQSSDCEYIITNNRRVNECFDKHKDKLEDGDFMDSYNQSIHKDVSPTITTRTNASGNSHIYKEVISHSLFPRTSKTGKGGSGHLSKTDGTSYCVDTGCSQGVEIIQLNNPIHSNDRIYSDIGISPTLNTMQGGNRQPFVHTGCSQGVEVIQLNPSKESGGKQPFQQNRVYDSNGLSPCLDTDSGRRNVATDKRIRRLTPLECWRLQGYTDEQFNKAQKVNSDTQLYKQAGNSITVDVMVELFKKIYDI